MSVELSTQAQFDGFADDVARKLGTHCRTAPGYAHMLSRDIVDDEGRALSLRQPDPAQPNRLRAYAALPDGSEIQTPSTASRPAAPGMWPGRSPGACTRCTPRPPGSPRSAPPGRRPRPATAAP
ncbi:hypothetical protein [Streptomyces aureus]|uniref:hypothetical protein n=1 Tax=Streptomyces aureus TaxID=193461 RepID=UPI0036AC9983